MEFFTLLGICMLGFVFGVWSEYRRNRRDPEPATKVGAELLTSASEIHAKHRFTGKGVKLTQRCTLKTPQGKLALTLETIEDEPCHSPR